MDSLDAVQYPFIAFCLASCVYRKMSLIFLYVDIYYSCFAVLVMTGSAFVISIPHIQWHFSAQSKCFYWIEYTYSFNFWGYIFFLCHGFCHIPSNCA